MRVETWMFALPLLVPAVPGVTHAQPAAPAAEAAADAAFKQGREAVARGDYQTALGLFRESYRLAPGKGNLVNLARCEARLGLHGSAMRHFRQALDLLPEDDDRRPGIAADVMEISPRVPYLRISLGAGAPAGTAVTVDGEAARVGADLPVDPGKRTIVASAGGRERRYALEVSEGGRYTLAVVPEAEATAPTATAVPLPAAPAEGRTTRWKLGVAAIGVGSASLVAGAVTGGLAVSRRNRLDTGCNGLRCAPDLASVEQEYHAFGNTSTATLVVGAALAATGVVLLAVRPGGREQGRGAWIAPVLGVGVVGARGRF